MLYCSHCSAFSSGREGGPSLSTRLTSHSHDVRSRLLSNYWPFCIHVLDSNMTFSERKIVIYFEAVNRKNKFYEVLDSKNGGNWTVSSRQRNCGFVDRVHFAISL